MLTDKSYFFILGKNPELSIAEILTLLKQKQIIFKLSEANEQALVIKSEELNQDFFNLLGGSKKFGEVIKVSEKVNFDFVKDILDGFRFDGKFRFGFSFYNISKSELKKIQSDFYKRGLSYKKVLKARGIKSRLVQTRDNDLSSVVVHKEKMIEQGVDVVVIKSSWHYLYGKTLAVQDYDAFSARDYGKPERDTIRGMLPPKLARMMINLAGLEQGSLIIDPFCGSGTVLLEALNMGYQVKGFDKEQSAINQVENNLIWYQQRYVLDQMPELGAVSVASLNKTIEANSVDAIVTEPYLGPPLRGKESKWRLQQIKLELENLYKLALDRFYSVLKSGGKVVMVLPVFIVKGDEEVHLQVNVDESKFTAIDVLEALRNQYDFLSADRNSYMYFRQGQKVWRNIKVWQKL